MALECTLCCLYFSLAFRKNKGFLDSLRYILAFIFIILCAYQDCVMFVSRLPAVWSHHQLTFLLSTSVCYISTEFIAKTHCHIKEDYVKVSACIITIANAPTDQLVSSITKCCVTY